MPNPYHDKRGRFTDRESAVIKTADELAVGDTIIGPDGKRHRVTKIRRPGTMAPGGMRPAHMVIHTDTGLRIPKTAIDANKHTYDVVNDGSTEKVLNDLAHRERRPQDVKRLDLISQQYAEQVAPDTQDVTGKGGADLWRVDHGTGVARSDSGAIITNLNLVDNRLLQKLYDAEKSMTPHDFNDFYKKVDPKTRHAYRLGYRSPGRVSRAA